MDAKDVAGTGVSGAAPQGGIMNSPEVSKAFADMKEGIAPTLDETGGDFGVIRSGDAELIGAQDIVSDGEGAQHDLSQSTEDSHEVDLDGDQKDDLTGDSEQDEEISEGGNVEEIYVTDSKGRRKVKIDFNNREQTKKAYKAAYGMRKFQAERDQAIETSKALQTKVTEKYEPLQKNWDALEKVFSEQGVEGVLELMEEGSVDKFKTQLLHDHEWRQNASPEQIEARNATESQEKYQKQLENERAENLKFKEGIESDREAAKVERVQSQVSPVFDKYRFDGKLGDAVDEEMFDNMLWDTTIKRLEPYEQKGLLSPDLIDKEFRKVSSAIRKRISKQVDRGVDKVVSQKKQEATENAQKLAKKGFKNNSTSEDLAALLNKPGGTGINQIFKQWGKFKDQF